MIKLIYHGIIHKRKSEIKSIKACWGDDIICFVKQEEQVEEIHCIIHLGVRFDDLEEDRIKLFGDGKFKNWKCPFSIKKIFFITGVKYNFTHAC